MGNHTRHTEKGAVYSYVQVAMTVSDPEVERREYAPPSRRSGTRGRATCSHWTRFPASVTACAI